MSLIVDRLDKDYPTRSGSLPVLRQIQFSMERGEAQAIIGPSGSGKSTLLHILGTLDQPSRGKVTLNGTDPFTLSEPELATFRNRHIGFVFQDHHLLPQCTVVENVLLPTLVNPQTRTGEAINLARSLLERVGLQQREDHYPSELSGGERQRAAVARALIHKPDLLLADEPTGNLDRANARAIGDLLIDIQKQENLILIVVTHSQELARLLPKTSEMIDGRLH